MEILKAFLVFPHQLFEINFSKSKNYIFYIIEEPLFFTQYKFHKQKLIFHRASMKYYESKLTELGFTARYLEYNNNSDLNSLLIRDSVSEVHCFQVVDDWLNEKIKTSYVKGFKLFQHETPMFLCNNEILNYEFDNQEHFSMSSFYISQRRRFDLLIKNTKAVGGKWSLDSENRKKLPKNIELPGIIKPAPNRFTLEAMSYVDLNFNDNIGLIDSFNFAITHEDARKCLIDFIENRMEYFGTYEDAISSSRTFLFHSVLSPYLNSGLLTPEEVLIEVMNYVEGRPIPLNSLEGFIRQLIGWREFMRAVYILKGRNIRTKNFWNHSRNISSSFYLGDIGIEPVDNVIKRVLGNSYTHHIERLMVLGNFMQLCEIQPHDIYQWFMEMYIDAYDWVMVPNVYSMSQYSDGGTITTKPYISSSNYILKMSDYKKDEWCNIWDGLYWRFIDKHKDFFSTNPRLSVMTYHLKRMSKKQLNKHYSVGEKFLKGLE